MVTTMRSYDQFHDGDLEGFWIDESKLHVLLRTVGKERFVAVLTGVAALSVRGLRSGNLILSVETYDHSEISSEDISDVYELEKPLDGQTRVSSLLAKAKQDRSILFVITPSYGATCLALAHGVEVLTQKEWLERHSFYLFGPVVKP